MTTSCNQWPKWDKKTLLKLLAAGGTTLSVVALVLSLCSGYLVVKLLRCIYSMQRTMPVVRKAAQLYIDNDAAAKKRAEMRQDEEVPF